MIHVRSAGPVDARQMAELLNAIVKKGGTTARTTPVTAQDVTRKMRLNPDQTSWVLAETDDGKIVGFQSLEPHTDLPSDAGDIATFVQIGQTGMGIGSKLFEHTKSAAKKLGYTWINATIRADNESGLTYYQSRGFEDYKRIPDTTLADGTIVDRICKRYDL